jgi:hypothetical protein
MQFRLAPRFDLVIVCLALTSGCFEDVDDRPGTDDTETAGDGDPTTGDGDPTTTGDGDPTTTGDGDPTTTGDGDPTTTGDDCSGAQICVEDAIPGWQGPVALYSGPIAATPPACQGGTPVKLPDMFDNVQTHEAADTCSCACGPLQNPTCASAGFFRSSHSSCFTVDQSWNLPPNNCHSLGSAFSARFRANAPNIVGGTCTPQLVQDLVEAEHTTRLQACSVDDSAASCGDGQVCMDAPQAPFGAQICIATEGDVQCPAGSSYIDRYVYHTGLQDNRSCGACACDLVEGSKCAGTVQLFSNVCSSLLATLSLDQCSASISNVSYARFQPSANQSGSCDESGGGIQGAVQQTGAWTLCCQ